MKFLRPYSNLCLFTLMILMCLYLYGCPEFKSIEQPSSVSPGEIFTVFIEATAGGVPGWGEQPYFGICLPGGWAIPGDAITCTGVYNEVITYDPNLALEQEALSPSPEGYYWWVGDGNGADVEGFVYGEIQIQTSGQLGLFSIDYMLGNSYDGLNLHRSDNHSIYIIDEYTPRGLRTVVQVDSVMLTWTAPVMTEGVVGYNVYRDGQLLNPNPIVDTTYIDVNLTDGVFYYSASSIYINGDEHLTPYEIKGLVFSGGSGEPNKPYQIASAEQLISITDFPAITNKCFVLINNIDLDPNLIGGIVSGQAVIPSFSGILDGNGFEISNLTLTGTSNLGLIGTIENSGLVQNLGVINANITGSRDHIGIIAGYNNGTVSSSYSTGSVTGNDDVGGLVGRNNGSIATSYSTGSVTGYGNVGGLAGDNEGTITSSYSTGTVTGNRDVGGLAGDNEGTITSSYSTGAVAGNSNVGGLVGIEDEHGSIITSSFWNIETSGQTTNAYGSGKTTAEMQTASIFLEAGWDFVDETANGTEDIWWINEGVDYPRLWWQYGQAFNPIPADGARDISPQVVLEWISGGPVMHHDIYLGQDREQVTFATPETVGAYCGRQTTGKKSYSPDTLDWDKTYYWRIDEVDETDPNSPWKGDIWSFTTIDYVVVLVVDDFETYDNKNNLIYRAWKDGWYEDANYPGNGTGSIVGNWELLYAECTIVHSGYQSMPIYYFNDGNMPHSNGGSLYYSEAERTWDMPQDWTIEEADTLTLYFRGEPDNSIEPLYVGIEDSAGHIAVATHPDADGVLATEWQKWHISLADLQADMVDVASVKKMIIGVGDRDNRHPGGTGLIYVDDICVTNRMP